MRKIAIFYLAQEAWDKVHFPRLCPDPVIRSDEYRFLRTIEGPQAAEINLEHIWRALQNIDHQAVFNAEGQPDRSMVVGDAVLVSDGEGVYDGYRIDSVGFADLDPEMTRALADRWAAVKTKGRVTLMTKDKDNTICCNCGWKGLVPKGSDVCPECRADWALSWVPGEPQEVPD